MDFVGISCFYHDSSACLVRDGKVIAAAQEERFSRQKNTEEFPIESLNFCSQFGNILFEDVDGITYFEKPYLKFSRILIEHINHFPFSLNNFLRTIPKWMGQRLVLPLVVQEELSTNKNVYFLDHHLSHAASAFLPSPFEEAAIMTFDGVGEWATATLGHGIGSNIFIDKELNYPDSLGLIYTTFTLFLGFDAHGSEGKTMGMAGYGKPTFLKEMDKIIKIYDDGSFKIDLKYFSFQFGLKMWNKKFEELFGKPHIHGTKWTEREFDIAASLQCVLEKVVVLSARNIQKATNLKNLCMAGGVSLNCVANAKILEETSFQNIFIQPAAGDAGGSLGSALYLSNTIFNEPRSVMNNCYLGPSYSESEILKAIKTNRNLEFTKLEEEELLKRVAQNIANDKIIGWFQGRMEFGPRALGARSILANPCSSKIKDILNIKIKKRESFRPFAPMVLEEKCSEFFNLNITSPYMLLAPTVKEHKRDLLPAITHEDGTARVQTIGKTDDVLIRKLIIEFEKIMNVPILLNTSFNRNNEPVVCTPQNAINCFLETGMDGLAIGSYWIEKKITH